MKSDWLLALWLTLAFLFDLFLLTGTSYLVFGLGHSGWWFLFACLLGSNVNLWKVMKRRFEVEE